jgi:hypothetical protein
MPLFRTLTCLVAGMGALLMVANSKAADTGFAGGTFTCLEYTNGLGDNSAGRLQSMVGKLWIQGYIAGFYTGKKTLEFSDDPAVVQELDALIETKCRANPQAAILNIAISQIVNEPHKVPGKALGGFTPSTYSCGQHLDAKGGAAASANAADLAELWAFAFIQGYKNVANPDVEIKPEFKGTLLNAVNKVCNANREKVYIDYLALVAERVKIAE